MDKRKEIKQDLRKAYNTLLCILDNTDTIGEYSEWDQKLEGIIVAGGAIASLLLGQTPKDYDFFLNSRKDVDAVLARLGKAGPSKYVVCSTENAVTLQKDGITLQVITKRTGHPKNVVSTFDFQHCKGWYAFHDDELNIPQKTMESITFKELMYCPSSPTEGITSLIRMASFVARGWSVSPSTVLAMVQRHDPEANLPNDMYADENENKALAGLFYGYLNDGPHPI